MKIELKVSVDLINDNDIIIKRNIINKYLVDLEDIKNLQETTNKKGTIVKSKCRIFVRDLGYVVVNHSYNYIKDLMDSGKKVEIKGFRK